MPEPRCATQLESAISTPPPRARKWRTASRSRSAVARTLTSQRARPRLGPLVVGVVERASRSAPPRCSRARRPAPARRARRATARGASPGGEIRLQHEAAARRGSRRRPRARPPRRDAVVRDDVRAGGARARPTVAWPMPLDAPVTSTVLPVRSSIECPGYPTSWLAAPRRERVAIVGAGTIGIGWAVALSAVVVSRLPLHDPGRRSARARVGRRGRPVGDLEAFELLDEPAAAILAARRRRTPARSARSRARSTCRSAHPRAPGAEARAARAARRASRPRDDPRELLLGDHRLRDGRRSARPRALPRRPSWQPARTSCPWSSSCPRRSRTRRSSSGAHALLARRRPLPGARARRARGLRLQPPAGGDAARGLRARARRRRRRSTTSTASSGTASAGATASSARSRPPTSTSAAASAPTPSAWAPHTAAWATSAATARWSDELVAQVDAERRALLPLEALERARRLARPGADAAREGAPRARALPAYPERVTGNELRGWRVEEFGRSRDGVPMRVFLPHGDGPIAGLLTAAQHGEEADTALMARRLLERVPGDETRWAVVPVLNPDGLLNGTRQNAAGVDLNRNFPAATWGPATSRTYPARHRARAPRLGEPHEHLVARLVSGLRARDAGADGARAAARAGARGRPAHPARADPRAAATPRATSVAGSPAPPTCGARRPRLAVPGRVRRLATEQGVPALVYEVEHAGLPALCAGTCRASRRCSEPELLAYRQTSGKLPLVQDDVASRMRTAIGRYRPWAAADARRHRALAEPVRRARHDQLPRARTALRSRHDRGRQPHAALRIVGKLEARRARRPRAGHRRPARRARRRRPRRAASCTRASARERTDALSVALDSLSADELDTLIEALPVLESLARQSRSAAREHAGDDAQDVLPRSRTRTTAATSRARRSR